MSQQEPFKDLLSRLRSGDEDAADAIYRRYAQSLCELAQKNIGKKLQRRADPEDVIQSVFRTFYRRANNGEFVIDHSGSLWNLLVRITLNKIRGKAEYHAAAKRDFRRETDVEAPVSPEAVAHEPSPDEAVALEEEIEFIVTGLSESATEILQLCLQGYSTTEIAEQVGCTRWTARRALDRVGERLKARLAKSLED